MEPRKREGGAEENRALGGAPSYGRQWGADRILVHDGLVKTSGSRSVDLKSEDSFHTNPQELLSPGSLCTFIKSWI